MTNAAVSGGASSSYRDGDAHCGCGRNRTPRASESPDAVRQWLTGVAVPDFGYPLQGSLVSKDTREPLERSGGPLSYDTAVGLPLRSPPADNFFIAAGGMYAEALAGASCDDEPI
jgi:hypothetical protein